MGRWRNKVPRVTDGLRIQRHRPKMKRIDGAREGAAGVTRFNMGADADHAQSTGVVAVERRPGIGVGPVGVHVKRCFIVDHGHVDPLVGRDVVGFYTVKHIAPRKVDATITTFVDANAHGKTALLGVNGGENRGLCGGLVRIGLNHRFKGERTHEANIENGLTDEANTIDDGRLRRRVHAVYGCAVGVASSQTAPCRFAVHHRLTASVERVVFDLFACTAIEGVVQQQTGFVTAHGGGHAACDILWRQGMVPQAEFIHVTSVLDLSAISGIATANGQPSTSVRAANTACTTACFKHTIDVEIDAVPVLRKGHVMP